jgi:Skp family chaperone for outer membrane proteins
VRNLRTSSSNEPAAKASSPAAPGTYGQTTREVITQEPVTLALWRRRMDATEEALRAELAGMRRALEDTEAKLRTTRALAAEAESSATKWENRSKEWEKLHGQERARACRFEPAHSALRAQLHRLREAFGHKAFDEVVTAEERKAW